MQIWITSEFLGDSLSYRVNSIFVFQDFGKQYNRISIQTDQVIDLPFVAGDYQQIVKDSQMKSNILKQMDTPLFNNAGLARIAEDVGENGILFLDLEEDYWLNSISAESDDLVIDLFYRDDKRLLYSFFNPSDKKTISLTLMKISDEGDTWKQIKSNSTDPIFRQYFIRRAMETSKSEKIKEIEDLPELMNADQVAKYLQLATKTIRNKTSKNEIPFEDAGGSPRYRKSDIDKWLKGKKV
jgi:excisionase family DNA binding protein